jgi:acylphosphatase
LEFCGEGPEKAEVDQVDYEESTDLKGFRNFEVIKKNK